MTRSVEVLEDVCSDITKDCLDWGNRSKLLDSTTAKDFSVPDGSGVADQISCYKWKRYPTGLNKHTDGIAVQKWTEFNYRHIALKIVLKRFWVVHCESGLIRHSYCVKYVMQCFLALFNTLHPLTLHAGMRFLIITECANVNSRLAVWVSVKKFCYLVSWLRVIYLYVCANLSGMWLLCHYYDWLPCPCSKTNLSMLRTVLQM